jgi:hypothetical protein
MARARRLRLPRPKIRKFGRFRKRVYTGISTIQVLAIAKRISKKTPGRQIQIRFQVEGYTKAGGGFSAKAGDVEEDTGWRSTKKIKAAEATKHVNHILRQYDEVFQWEIIIDL